MDVFCKFYISYGLDRRDTESVLVKVLLSNLRNTSKMYTKSSLFNILKNMFLLKESSEPSHLYPCLYYVFFYCISGVDFIARHKTKKTLEFLTFTFFYKRMVWKHFIRILQISNKTRRGRECWMLNAEGTV